MLSQKYRHNSCCPKHINTIYVVKKIQLKIAFLISFICNILTYVLAALVDIVRVRGVRTER